MILLICMCLILISVKNICNIQKFKKKMKFNINIEKEGIKVIINYYLLKIN